MPSPLNTPTRRRFTGPPGSRDSPKNTYSDRFIPNRLSTNLEEAFDMMENRDSSLRENRGKHERHDSSSSMDGLLRSELLGHAVFGPGDLQAPSPARRESGGLFKYRSPHVSDSRVAPTSVALSSPPNVFVQSSTSSLQGGSLESQFSAGSDGKGVQSAFITQSPDRRASLGR
jgi:hypothetical protein